MPVDRNSVSPLEGRQVVGGMPWVAGLCILAAVCFGNGQRRPIAAMPTNRQILTAAYGKCDPSGNSSTRAASSESIVTVAAHPDSLTFSVVFVSRVRLDSEELVLAVCDAQAISLQEHRFGYRDFFLLRRIGKEFRLVKSQSDTELSPLGDRTRFEVVEIGRGKLALAADLVITRDRRVEVNRTFLSITREGVRNLFTVDMAYSSGNKVQADRPPGGGAIASDSVICPDMEFESKCDIVSGDKDWFDVRVHRTNFGYSQDCKVRFSESEEDYVLTHDDSGYHEVEKPLAD